MVVAGTFRIPAAFDADGELVAPDGASRRRVYRCPACDGRVDLHAGEKKRRHFHHRSSACSAESVTHLTAKLFIARAVTEWLAGGPAIVFVRRCAHADCDARCRQPIPAKVGAASVEHRLRSGHVVDVALLARLPQAARAIGRSPSPLPVAAIEVHHTHAVGAGKALEMGVPWIEVDAEQACETSGRELVVTTDRFLPWFCADHQGERGLEHRAVRTGRSSAAALARKLPFRIRDYPGFRIARAASCPNGHAALVFAWEGKEPPWPRPELVVAVEKDFDGSFGRAGGRPRKPMRWRRSYASACPECGAIVADP